MKVSKSRRLFLTGAATFLALPFLPSAVWTRRAAAANCTAPRRFMAWMVPNGMVMNNWTPTTTGKDWKMTPILAPLEPVRKKIMVLTGLDNQKTAVPGRPPGDHGAGTGMLLNMIPVNGHTNDRNRTSIDQVLLPALNSSECGTPRLPSLNIGLQGDNGLCDSVSCDFSRAISWIQGRPQPNIYDPRALFDRMFTGIGADDGMSRDESARRSEEHKSVLDAVLSDINSLNVKLSAGDRLKLDEYATSLRELEQRIDNTGTGVECTVPARPAASPPLNQERGITPSTIVERHTAIFVDLMALAFTCDITRSITFMLGNGTSNNDYEFLIGRSTPHHGTSHHQNNRGKLEALTKIDTWEIEQVAKLLGKLDAAKEADGRTVLDNTTFYMSSDIADGDSHNHWDMPILVAGGAGGALKIDGRHVNYTPDLTFPRGLIGKRSDVHTGRVLISILQAHGIMVDKFGEAKGGPLPELMQG
ncbi:DUF1552 domain-containing protein [Sorangium sp. So ce291]|uniref:DUF1552 domain-containing protein n=2 Tax=unclassified Sorangium TaxID=2621164 RepID=UPI003F5E4FE6